jgi:hypothetical protein
VKKIFEDAGATDPEDFLSTAAIVDELNTEKEAPWVGWRKDKGISAEKLSAILRRYDIRSEQRQINNIRTRGYSFGALKPIFDHYL